MSTTLPETPSSITIAWYETPLLATDPLILTLRLAGQAAIEGVIAASLHPLEIPTVFGLEIPDDTEAGTPASKIYKPLVCQPIIDYLTVLDARDALRKGIDVASIGLLQLGESLGVNEQARVLSYTGRLHLPRSNAGSLHDQWLPPGLV